MDFNNVIEKFGYDEYLGNLLQKIYKSQVKFFGSESEEAIYNVYLNTKVYTGNCFDMAKELGFTDENGKGIVKNDDLRRAAGVYFTKPILEFDGTNYNLKDVRRAVVINSDGLKTEPSIGTLTHELSHLVKRYYGEFTIQGDTLIERSGFQEWIYKLSHDENNKVKKTMIREKNVGIEEGFNSVLEEELMHDIGYTDYKVDVYGVVNQIAKNYLEIEDFETFLRCEFYKDYEGISNKFTINGINYFEEISKVTDQIYELTLEIFASIFNAPKRDELSETQRHLIKDVYLPLIDSVSELRKGV